MPRFLVHLEVSLFVIYQARTQTHRHTHKYQTYTQTRSHIFIYLLLIGIIYMYNITNTFTYTYILINIVVVSDIFIVIIFGTLFFPVSLPVCDKMSNTKISHLFPDDKDIATMQQTESLLVPSKPDSPDSSLSPCHLKNQSKRQRHHKQQDQEQDQEQEQEQEKLQDESREKRKWECVDEASPVEIHETPRKSNSVCYCPPRTPRKPKVTPAMKRRAMWMKRSVVFLDVAREVESMFPPSVLQDFGKKIKKARS